MGLFKKVKFSTPGYQIKTIFCLGFLLCQYIKIKRYNKILDKFKTYYFIRQPFFYKPKQNQRIFYLKVHRVHRTAIDCIRQWVNIVNKMHAFIYFVCDNPNMKEEIYKNIKLPNKKFKFIKSDRKTLRHEINKILHKVERAKMWKRIAYSLLTPYVHAQKNNIHVSYNIDADDILLCAEPKKVAEAFIEAENYALKNDIDLLNFDMFYSKSYGVHWSFGVVICTNPSNCLNTLKTNTDWRTNKKLIEKYNICWLDKFNFNVDWFFTFLRDTNQLNMKTFYIENAVVAHMPDIILEHGWAFMLQWKDNNIHFPILTNFYKRAVWDNVPIPAECIKIDVNLQDEDYKHFLCNFYDFGVGFEMDMLNYAKNRNLITNEIYDKYASTWQFVREQQWRSECENRERKLRHKKNKTKDPIKK